MSVTLAHWKGGVNDATHPLGACGRGARGRPGCCRRCREVGSGFVENIHANGPMIYAHELDYTLGQVALHVVTIP